MVSSGGTVREGRSHLAKTRRPRLLHIVGGARPVLLSKPHNYWTVMYRLGPTEAERLIASALSDRLPGAMGTSSKPELR
jgi:hypothetical protein